MRAAAVTAWFGRRVPGHSLAALRIAFGTLMLVATIRFAARGWIDSLYLEPSFHFTYYGFGFVRPWPAPWLYLHFALLGLAALLVALGLFYRVAIALLLLLFGYVELLDVTTYLNHYYAITLVAALLVFVPAQNVASLDAWRARRRGAPLDETVPWASIFVLRAQLGIVYFFAGVAKLHADWLFDAQPLSIWLAARTDAPVIGPLLGYRWVALAMSWAGAIFDLTIPFWLSWNRTRAAAYLTVVTFHVVTWELFPIGMFPWIMIGLTPIFFAPDWPRRILRRRTDPAEPTPSRPIGRLALGAMALWLLVQIAMPLRHHLYRGDVLETEQGFRWSWYVMIVERGGVATFRVQHPDGRVEEVAPRDLTLMQRRMMATQPDLVLQYAHHLRDQRQGERVRVYADVFVSTNGRPNRRLVDPAVDLAAEEDTVFGYDWVLTPDDPRR